MFQVKRRFDILYEIAVENPVKFFFISDEELERQVVRFKIDYKNY